MQGILPIFYWSCLCWEKSLWMHVMSHTILPSWSKSSTASPYRSIEAALMTNLSTKGLQFCKTAAIHEANVTGHLYNEVLSHSHIRDSHGTGWEAWKIVNPCVTLNRLLMSKSYGRMAAWTQRQQPWLIKMHSIWFTIETASTVDADYSCNLFT